MKAKDRLAKIVAERANRERAERERAKRSLRVFADGIRRRAKTAIAEQERYKRFRERNG